MANTTESPRHPGHIRLLSSLTPPSLTRAWLSAPHPYLPLVATCSSDRQVRVYSLQNFKLHSTIDGGHKRSVRSCAWNPGTKGESVLATGSFDASAGIWRRYDDNASGMMRDDHQDESDRVRGDDDEEEEDEWRFSVVLDGHESEIKSVAWSAGGQYLATCSRDKSVWLWEELDADEFETVAVLQDHEADVKCVCWHPEEELLASGSYDDTVRLYKEDLDDWTCVSVLTGHDSTVWALDFEPTTPSLHPPQTPSTEQTAYVERSKAAGSRLVSASADMTVRIWRRVPKEHKPVPDNGLGKIPSIIQSSSADEEWIPEVTLPQIHEREVYSTAWSKKSGRIVSAGGDGRIVVYEERWLISDSSREGQEKMKLSAATDGQDEAMILDGPEKPATQWIVLTEFEGAHGVFEVNHVCWGKRWDRGRKEGVDEEVIISTGDDGVVNVWTLDSDDV
jgi:WD40 repeat protein